MATETLHDARDVEIYRRIRPDVTIRAEIKGRLTRLGRRGSVAFGALSDASGNVQLKLLAASLGPAKWETAGRDSPSYAPGSSLTQSCRRA